MKSEKTFFHELKRIFHVYDRNTRLKLKVFAALQVFLSLLDLVGVFLIGTLALESVGSVKQGNNSENSNFLIVLLGLSEKSQTQRILYVATLAIIVLGVKTLLSVIFTKQSMFFLSNRATAIAHDLFSKYLTQPLQNIQKKSQQEIVFILTEGIHAITIQVSGSLIILIADFSLLVLMAVGLIMIDPVIAVFTITFFVLIGLYLHKVLSVKAAALGSEYFRLSILRNSKIVEALNSFRQAVTGARRAFYLTQVSSLRSQLARVEAQRSLMPYIGKYVIETSIVMGMILVTGFQFTFNSPAEAARNIAIFLAAGTRIAPAVLRIQQSMNQMKIGISLGAPTLDLIEKSLFTTPLSLGSNSPKFSHDEFIPSVQLVNVNMSYLGNSKFSLESISLSIAPYEFVAIVGTSGSGKTTLVDAILGINPPTSGTVLISGMNPLDAYDSYPGAVAYVPQETALIDGTVLENIAAGYSSPGDYLKEVSVAINGAALGKFIKESDYGLNTHVGEKGASISGGQRQRIGIARALFTRPKLLILDEATSALDQETESMISSTLLDLRGKCTILAIAHRVSTIKNADRIIYLREGKLVQIGDYAGLIKEFPEFLDQVEILDSPAKPKMES